MKDAYAYAPTIREYLVKQGERTFRWGRDDDDEWRRFHRAVLRAMGELDIVPPAEAWQDWATKIANFIAKLGPLTPYLADPRVTDIEVRGGYAQVVRDGIVESVGTIFSQDEVLSLAHRLARLRYAKLDTETPQTIVELPDDAGRCTIVIPPVADKVIIEIRRPAWALSTPKELIGVNTLNENAAKFLKRIVPHAVTLVSGPKGAGKTTLLGVLTGLLPETRPVTIIEEGFKELPVQMPHPARMVNPKHSTITTEELIADIGSRMPGGLLIGEIVKAGEARQFLEIIRQGTTPAMATIHAGSGYATLLSFQQKVYAETARAYEEVIGLNVDLVLHMRELSGGRRVVAEIMTVEGWLRERDRYDTTTLQTYSPAEDRWIGNPLELAEESRRMQDILRWVT